MATTAGHCGSEQTYYNRRINSYFSSEYLWQQNSVCGKNHNKIQCMCVFMVMKEQVTQRNDVSHWCVFNSLWTTMALYDTEEGDVLGYTHKAWLGSSYGNVLTGIQIYITNIANLSLKLFIIFYIFPPPNCVSFPWEYSSVGSKNSVLHNSAWKGFHPQLTTYGATHWHSGANV